MSMPIAGGSLSVHVASSINNAQIVLAAQFAPFGPAESLTPPCMAHVDVSSPTTTVLNQYSTDSSGQWTSSFPLGKLPELASVTFRVQAAVVSPGGPLANVQLSDALQGTIGNCPPCTASREDWVGVGTVGTVYAANWLTLFPGGMDIGIFNPGNGNAAPNGFRWTGDLTGQNALLQLLANLAPPGSPNSIILQDVINPTTTVVASPGSGSLARYTAVLQLNIVFSAHGLLGGTPVPQPGIGPLVYMNPGDSLNGFTANQILALANQVLAGVAPVPAGYTLTSLADLLEQLSLSFENCTPSAWAMAHLFVAV